MAVFHHCDLSGTTFVKTTLEKTDFRTAINYSIDPELNQMKKAKFSNSRLASLTDRYGIHWYLNLPSSAL